MQEQYNKFIQSVKTYGGFYVGRYEMGKGSNYSKIGVEPTSAYDSETSMWYGLYNKAKSYSKSSVSAGMIWGSQYDAVLNYGLTNSNDAELITENYSSGINHGNHSSTKLKTGIFKGSDSINNIFDIEGNMCEWTQEAYDSWDRVVRGGDYLNKNPTWSRIKENPNGSGDMYFTGNEYGTRLCLYVK